MILDKLKLFFFICFVDELCAYSRIKKKIDFDGMKFIET